MKWLCCRDVSFDVFISRSPRLKLVYYGYSFGWWSHWALCGESHTSIATRLCTNNQEILAIQKRLCRTHHEGSIAWRRTPDCAPKAWGVRRRECTCYHSLIRGSSPPITSGVLDWLSSCLFWLRKVRGRAFTLVLYVMRGNWCSRWLQPNVALLRHISKASSIVYSGLAFNNRLISPAYNSNLANQLHHLNIK